MRLAMLLLRLAAALRPAARLPLRRAARGAATDYGADQITVLEGLCAGGAGRQEHHDLLQSALQ